MNRHQLSTLPPTLDVRTAGSILGLGRTASYELIRCGQWPTPVLRLGHCIRIPTMPLLRLLELELENQTTGVERVPQHA